MPRPTNRNNRRDLVSASSRFNSGEHHHKKKLKSVPPPSPDVVTIYDDPLDEILAEDFEMPLAFSLAEATKKRRPPPAAPEQLKRAAGDRRR